MAYEGTAKNAAPIRKYRKPWTVVDQMGKGLVPQSYCSDNGMSFSVKLWSQVACEQLKKTGLDWTREALLTAQDSDNFSADFIMDFYIRGGILN